MGKVMIVAVSRTVERGKPLLQRLVHQGFVFHVRLKIRDAGPLEQTLRKFEFTGAMIWHIPAPDKASGNRRSP
jgi:hypothetical protein